MSRKKTNKSDYSLFAKNINAIATENGGKYALAESLGVVYDSVRRWCNGENLPDGQILLTIQDKFKVSIDWLLTGKESPPPAANPEKGFPPAHWPEEVRAACRQCRDILLSDHKTIKPALLSNLAAFHSGIQTEAAQKHLIAGKDAEIQQQNEKIDGLTTRLAHVEQLLDSKQCTGAGKAASSNTGKPET